MKKLFTLLVGLVAGLNAMADDVITDYEMDWSTQSSFNYWKADTEGTSVNVDGGALILSNTNASIGNWQAQAQVASNIDTSEGSEGAVYDITFTIKGSEAGSVYIGLGTWSGTKGANMSFTTEYQDVTIQASGVSAATSFILAQWGSFIGDIYISKIKVTHEALVTALPFNLTPDNVIDVKSLTGTNTGWAKTVVYPKTFQSQGEVFGDGEGSNEGTYVNIKDYSKLSFNVSTPSDKGLALRVWLWDGSGVVTLYPHPDADYATANFADAYEITEAGVYSVNISGYSCLKGVKAANKWEGQTPLVVDFAWVSNGEKAVAVDECRTFNSSKILDFSEVTDVEAYIATACDGSKVTMEKVTGVVPANTALVLKQVNDNVTVSIPAQLTCSTTIDNNLLVATTAETTVEALAGATNYVLAGSGDKLGWYSIGTGHSATVAAGKAYLSVPFVAPAKKITMSFDDEATAIKTVDATKANSACFNLAGQRVNNNAKGLVICNGKKFMNK